MGFTDQIKKTTLRTAFNYLEKNPEENAPKLLDWVDRLAGDGPDPACSIPSGTCRPAEQYVSADYERTQRHRQRCAESDL